MALIGVVVATIVALFPVPAAAQEIDTVILSGPAEGSTTADTTPEFDFAATGEFPATFECRVDADEFEPCVPPYTTKPLADGEHTFEVRAKGPENVDQTPAQRTFTVEADQRVIASAGPLTEIFLNRDLACQVNYSGDKYPEFYGSTDPGSCGTFLSAGGVSYGPQSVVFGTSPAAYALAGQSAVTGSGTVQSPYQVVTTVHVGKTGLDITQTDTYIVGQESYRSDIAITNTNAEGGVSATLYHAGDCYLQESDSGYGFHDAGSGGIFCAANANNSPAGRLVGFVPLSAGSHYLEDTYLEVWSAIKPAGTLFGDTCDCEVFEDNGAGLSWGLTLFPGETQTRSLITAFSPGGVVPDTTPPQTIIDSGPAGPTNDPTPTFEFHSSEAGSTFQCSIDTGTPAFAPCSGPGLTHTPSALPDGDYTFRVRATDQAANTDPSPADRSFTIDTTEPVAPPSGTNTGHEVPKPRFGKAIVVAPLRGKVFVKLPHGKRFVRLTELDQVPLGTIFDTTQGRVRLTSAKGRKGNATQSADFYRGVFLVRQPASGEPRTELKLIDGLRRGQRSHALSSGGRRSRRGRHRRRNGLWGSGKGNFKTIGNYGSASVRGTIWFTQDRPDGTLFRVKRGIVLVEDFTRHRKLRLHPGQRYLAPAR